MRQTTGTRRSPGEKLVKDIKRATRRQYSSEEKIRIVLDGLRGEDSIAELCRREASPKRLFAALCTDVRNGTKLPLPRRPVLRFAKTEHVSLVCGMIVLLLIIHRSFDHMVD
jgi:hypothetical protein